MLATIILIVVFLAFLTGANPLRWFAYMIGFVILAPFIMAIVVNMWTTMPLPGRFLQLLAFLPADTLVKEGK